MKGRMDQGEAGKLSWKMGMKEGWRKDSLVKVRWCDDW